MYERQEELANGQNVDQIIKEELRKQDGTVISFEKGDNYERVEVEQKYRETPDPRIHGAKIIFDSRMDSFSQNADDLQSQLRKQDYPKITLKDKKEALFGKQEETDEFNEEPSKIRFKKSTEADSGENEAAEERRRSIQQKLINFKRELAEDNVPIEFLDFVLRGYKETLITGDIAEKDFDNFLQFLKVQISKLKLKNKNEAPKYMPLENYTIEYLSKASSSNADLSKARKELNPHFSSLKD